MASVIKNLQNNLITETESKEEMIEKYKSLKTSHDQQLNDIIILKTDIKNKELEISNLENKLDLLITEQAKIKKNYSSSQLHITEDEYTISGLKREISTK